MVSSRTATAAVGLVASLVVSVLLWWYFDTFVFLLFLPFVPILLGRGGGDDATPDRVRTCSTCGFRTRNDDYEYCPRDGTRLEE
ncbi:hypothetical protein VB773_16420 [Haloarculaceae archaeon H-GB2-1]|nr:hypothetical protein [Haloarculaceae archaeon H-GB1-1]MEA5387514.1 hypothetical protein [Haloarculaceae archaeon H-GB11]MEA5408996.1 hypothetical protein [Haloarculaceae archaeon H-GB2-1]